ncbi:HAMP domain-containing histidine kinase [Vibrio profundum]|uniref:sensor histidine kinase n=1 Tax=Vibrio profundum TaxID=2910247 RepID=UPI003D124DF1
MPSRLLRHTKTLTGRLALFFTGIALIIGLFTFLIFIFALQWSEDKAGERMLMVDRDEAIYKFTHGTTGPIKIDSLTTAYNDYADIPEPFRDFAKSKNYYLDEVAFDSLPVDYMMYVGHYFVKGKKYPIVMVLEIDRIEFDISELADAGAIVLALILGLILMFAIVLNRLSKKLIAPLNDIHAQLEQLGGDVQQPFTMLPEAAEEFQVLVDKINGYREDMHTTIKREQAFARYASHELRTPLTIIKGASKLLSRQEHSSFQLRQMTRIDSASQQMETMIDALLSLVRYERSEDSSPDRELSNDELLEIITQNSAQAEQKELQIVLKIHSLPTVCASTSVMNMLVGNLLRNAIAATPEGQIVLTVDSEKLTIVDQGHGLLPTPNKDGHGLGLLIVDDLCRRYGWAFSLKENVNRGCVAKIEFSL